MPSIICAGSPGMTKRTEKTAMETSNRRRKRIMSFLIKYRIMDARRRLEYWSVGVVEYWF
jgi:hypothetical protein